MRAAFAGESQAKRRSLYFAQNADIAEGFETLAKAERSHANSFKKALDALE
ncbi:MAG: hypothetical protein L0Y67_07430 [Gammaproteobacteria bacterium]|nr:hypothetical protein [Gammaproteobacteria bacterium]MCI0591415.1 hypothetical protein [Gammaproteobacteria bacterium]